MTACAYCEKEFKKRRATHKFCCRSCQAFALAPINRKKRKGVLKTCTVCQKEFYIPQYRVEIAEYCSRSCLAKKHLAQFAEFRLKPTGKPPHRYKTMTINGKSVRIHRHLMETHLGRKLNSQEHVHHINGDPFDNRLENLMVLWNGDHQRIELRERGHSKRK